MVRIDRSFTYLAEIVNRVRGSEAAVGRVVIEHESLTGHDEKIERPVDDAVSLFWRFLLEKWDVKSARLSIRTWASRNALSCR